MAILALAFDSPPAAHDALVQARRLHDEQHTVHDVVVVSGKDGHGKVIESMDPSPVAAAVPSTLFGALVGSIVAGPLGFLIGSVVAGATGALVVKLVDTGIPHRLVAQLCKRTKSGQSVVALLVDDVAVDELSHLPGARVVHSA
jgi:uncharacterized membrane protein